MSKNMWRTNGRLNFPIDSLAFFGPFWHPQLVVVLLVLGIQLMVVFTLVLLQVLLMVQLVEPLMVLMML